MNDSATYQEDPRPALFNQKISQAIEHSTPHLRLVLSEKNLSTFALTIVTIMGHTLTNGIGKYLDAAWTEPFRHLLQHFRGFEAGFGLAGAVTTAG